MSVNRVIVDRTLYPAFAELVVQRVSKLKVGNPNDVDTVIGPLVNQSQLTGLLSKIDQAHSAGLARLFGPSAESLVLPPHVFGDVKVDAPLARDETFGPLLPLLIADDEAHALLLANASEYGLSNAVFTKAHWVTWQPGGHNYPFYTSYWTTQSAPDGADCFSDQVAINRRRHPGLPPGFQ